MATEIITSFDQQCDASGNPMSGALVYVYDVGTTTLRTISASTTLSPSAANPIVCDSSGRHDMRYTATGSYKIVVKTSAAVTVYTRDNIDGRVPVGAGALAIANGGTGATSAGAAVTALGAATAASVAALAAEVAAVSGAQSSSEKTHIATGTTAQRPAVPVEGDIRRNTTTTRWEGYVSGWQNIHTDSEGLATQAEQETGTSILNYVTPGRQQYHSSAAKAWVRYGTTGNPLLSYNTASVTDSGAGIQSPVWTVAMSSANLCASATASFDHAGSDATSLIAQANNTGIAASGVTIVTSRASDGAKTDPSSTFVIAFGDQ